MCTASGTWVGAQHHERPGCTTCPRPGRRWLSKPPWADGGGVHRPHCSVHGIFSSAAATEKITTTGDVDGRCHCPHGPCGGHRGMAIAPPEMQPCTRMRGRDVEGPGGNSTRDYTGSMNASEQARKHLPPSVRSDVSSRPCFRTRPEHWTPCWRRRFLTWALSPPPRPHALASVFGSRGRAALCPELGEPTRKPSLAPAGSPGPHEPHSPEH